MEVRTRFAPSPTGFMHLGGLRTALYNYLFARKMGGKFILRIEDTDQERFVEGATEVIYDTLRGCGMNWDEGPDVGGPCGPYIQSQRKELYLPYARQLVESGHAYYCFCTKEELDERRAACEARGEVFKYDKHCLHLTKEEIQRKLDAGVPYVIRQNAPTQGETSYDDLVFGHMTFPNDTLDDMVLIKQDGMPTYNFANVIDDHLMGITHVMRGMEYLSSTPKYNLLYEAFGWEVPQYIHLPTVMRDAHHKLSKRDGDAYYSDFVDKGYLTEALINYLVLVGWNPGDDREFFTMDELVDVFDVHRLNKAPGIFDIEKLTWFNAEYIRRMAPEKYLEMATPWFDKALAGKGIDYRRLAELMQIRTEVFSRVPDMVRFLAELPEYDMALYTNKKSKTNPEVSRAALQMLRPVLAGVEDWTETAIHDALMEAITQAGMKNAAALWPLRIAISGQESTPGGAVEIAWLLGREETLRRLDDGLKRLENAEYIRCMAPEKYLEMATPWFDKALAGKGIDYRRLAELTQTCMEAFSRLPGMVRFLAELPDYDAALYTDKKSKTNPEVSRAALQMLRPVLAGVEDWTETAIHDALMEAIARAGMKDAAALWPLRIAISGQASAPGGAVEIAWLLGREETLRRLDDGLKRLENA